MEQQNNKKTKKYVVIILILLLIPILLYGGYYFFISTDDVVENTDDNSSLIANQDINIIEENENENINTVPTEKESTQDILDEWNEKLGGDPCAEVNFSNGPDEIYEYALNDNESIALVLCRVGGTSSTYVVYYYNAENDSSNQLDINGYYPESNGYTSYVYTTFASDLDYEDFVDTGLNLDIHELSNGRTTCGLNATYVWNDVTKQYDLKYFKGNLYCEKEIEEENWEVLKDEL